MPSERYDVVVVGSGFGGSVAALRLTEKGYRVGILEAGRRFGQHDFARTSWRIRKYLWFPRLGMRGIQRLTLLKDALVLSGAGVGGGSLVYANTMREPLEEFWADPDWPPVTDWKAELAPHYARARRMLGATRTPFDTPADRVMRELAARLSVADSFEPVDVAVYFGEPGREGEEATDPYFGGLGPARSACVRCGGCMVGCRHGAKNSLDRNYLHLAELLGADIHPDTQVIDVVPLHGGSFAVRTQRPGAWVRRRPKTFVADQVVFAGGVLGTLKLLLALRGAGRLPRLSPQLGHLVRTNSEAIVGATSRRSSVDLSSGVAITSAIHPDRETQIEPVRYSKGSNLMGLLGTVLVPHGNTLPQPVRFLAEIARHPVEFARSLSVRRWSERSLILLVMQAKNSSLRLLLKGGPRWRRLTSAPERGAGVGSPTDIADRAARITADIIGGQPRGSLNDALLGIPITAHILGGACLAVSPDAGVVDPYHRVFGHPGLHVVDASCIPANLGANPALTITALAERAMAFWPNKGDPDPRPPLGGDYRKVEPVSPDRPAVPDRRDGHRNSWSEAGVAEGSGRQYPVGH